MRPVPVDVIMCVTAVTLAVLMLRGHTPPGLVWFLGFVCAAALLLSLLADWLQVLP